jgi:rare lipoprotein A
VSASSPSTRSWHAVALVLGTAGVIAQPNLTFAAEPTWPAPAEVCAGATALLPSYLGCVARPAAPWVPPVEARLGLASYYANRFHGRRTASGARYDRTQLTAAHRSLPFGTLVRVTNPHNRRSVVVRINDRGPYIRGRELDLSREAARVLGVLTRGVARVAWEIIPSPGAGSVSGGTVAAAP